MNKEILCAALKFSNSEILWYVNATKVRFDTGIKSQESNISLINGKPLMLCAVARTGGMYLCDLLKKNGFNEIDEYFRHDFPLSGMGFSHINELLDGLFNESISNHQNLGIKVGIFDLIPLIFEFGFPLPLSKFSWVYLTREDVLGQAISLAVAQKTEVWSVHKDDEETKRIRVNPDEILFDKIYDNLLVILEDMRRWEAFFAITGIVPTRISYEQLVAEPVAVAGKVLNSCNMSRKMLNADVDIIQQRNEINEQLRQEFFHRMS